ncbi:serine/threonine-protein kinase [Luteitalea sp. TBR-22]|uniref:serine/threonine-protein kinase n=1 Tax=Luteitalea sp. TBR-22 TaxID=2802971 RepID=UPI00351D4AF8
MFAWLPEADRRWVVEAGVAVVARLAAPDGHTVGAILVGTRADGRASSRRALAFVSAAAGTAGVALATLATTAGGDAPRVCAAADELPYECQACGRLSPEAARCACGGATVLAALPAVLNEAFALERRIGRGGMGVVYRAYDTRLDRLVALKTLPALAPPAAQALQAEARAMAALEHPSIASLYGLERWRGTPVLVVEYLAGGTLASRIATGPMRPGDVVVLARVLAEALATLHARGWLHGDIKPSNIGLTRDGVPKLLDFGLTRWHAMAAPGPGGSGTVRPADGTRSGALAGTPLYLSPEALDGHPAGDADDVWALALVIVELITGVHPFRADTLDAVADRVRAHPTIDVRHWAPATPPWLAEALAAALHPDRRQRLTRARVLADVLERPASAHEHGAAAS